MTKRNYPASSRKEINPIFGLLFSRYHIPYAELGRNVKDIYGIFYALYI